MRTDHSSRAPVGLARTRDLGAGVAKALGIGFKPKTIAAEYAALAE
jgi:hypothetical protein